MRVKVKHKLELKATQLHDSRLRFLNRVDEILLVRLVQLHHRGYVVLLELLCHGRSLLLGLAYNIPQTDDLLLGLSKLLVGTPQHTLVLVLVLFQRLLQ